jgi:UDP-glucose 4-epimerase
MLVTGGAGFIGTRLVKELVKEHDVVILDNLSTGKKENVNRDAGFLFGDLTDKGFVLGNVKGFDFVFHLAANPDVRIGAKDTRVDVSNMMSLYNVLEAMRRNDVKNIVFTSSSVVYGRAKMPTPEDYGPLEPISIYGASKLACEGFISGYAHTFGLKAWVYRLANVIGPNCHGIIPDFIRKLEKNPKTLQVLGNGLQEKSYVHVDDCVSGMLAGLKSRNTVNVFNIGSEDTITARRIAELVIEKVSPKAEMVFTGGEQGWVGDVPKMWLDIKKLKSLGWSPKYTSEQAVRKTIEDIVK